MNRFKHLMFAEGFYFLLSSIALSSLLMSSSDDKTKFYGALEFVATLWVTVAWILNARFERKQRELAQK